MPDANELVKALKKAAVEAVDASKPVNVLFGEVISESPLRINVEQKMVLGESQLVLTQNVKELKTEIDISGDSIACKKEITLRKGLAKGDNVILIRQQEGQKYIVLDRIG